MFCSILRHVLTFIYVLTMIRCQWSKQLGPIWLKKIFSSSRNCRIYPQQIKIENISTTMQEGRSLFMWFFFFPNQICRLNKEGIWIDKNVQRIYCCLNYSEQTLHSSNIPPILLKIIIGKVLNKIPLSYHCNPNENPS